MLFFLSFFGSICSGGTWRAKRSLRRSVPSFTMGVLGLEDETQVRLSNKCHYLLCHLISLVLQMGEGRGKRREGVRGGRERERERVWLRNTSWAWILLSQSSCGFIIKHLIQLCAFFIIKCYCKYHALANDQIWGCYGASGFTKAVRSEDVPGKPDCMRWRLSCRGLGSGSVRSLPALHS